jgi:3-oxoacyl-[acyl-carrier-protein] synthase-3
MSRISARIEAIEFYLPDQVITNQDLANIYPEWSAENIFDKTGIRERRIAGPGQTAGDLAFEAANKLFSKKHIHPSDVDFMI